MYPCIDMYLGRRRKRAESKKMGGAAADDESESGSGRLRHAEADAGPGGTVCAAGASRPLYHAESAAERHSGKQRGVRGAGVRQQYPAGADGGSGRRRQGGSAGLFPAVRWGKAPENLCIYRQWQQLYPDGGHRGQRPCGLQHCLQRHERRRPHGTHRRLAGQHGSAGAGGLCVGAGRRTGAGAEQLCSGPIRTA